jgi:hypothetical protein
LSVKPHKFELKFLCAVILGREILNVQRVFPTNLSRQTYVALCESCRSIAPLQLLYLEIFHLVGYLWSYGILKTVSRNDFGRWRRKVAPQRVVRARAQTAPPRVVPALLRCTDAVNLSPWTRASSLGPPPTPLPVRRSQAAHATSRGPMPATRRRTAAQRRAPVHAEG